MKKYLLIMIFTMSFQNAWSAHQYIQCAYKLTDARIVVSIDGGVGTYFYSANIQFPDPDARPKPLRLVNADPLANVYQTEGGRFKEMIRIPRRWVGRQSKEGDRFFNMHLYTYNRETGRKTTSNWTCYSAIYN